MTFNQAILEATYQEMENDSHVVVFGEGVNDPGGIFGTTLGLKERFGEERIQETPVSENAMTGIMLGAALNGLKPIFIFQRADFALYAMDQIVNNVAKWSSMFGGEFQVPLVMRMVMGQGWGQGHQHAQNLQAMFSHFPGLQVVTPSTPYSAKGLLSAAINCPSPVIFLEHKWCQDITGQVPKELYQSQLHQSCLLKEGNDLTIVSNSYWSMESYKACMFLSELGIEVDLIDLRSLTPIDFKQIKKSLLKTQRLLVVDGSWKSFGLAAEIIAQVSEDSEINLITKPSRLTFSDHYSPSSPHMANQYYINAKDIFKRVQELLECQLESYSLDLYMEQRILDKPDHILNGDFPNI